MLLDAEEVKKSIQSCKNEGEPFEIRAIVIKTKDNENTTPYSGVFDNADDAIKELGQLYGENFLACICRNRINKKATNYLKRGSGIKDKDITRITTLFIDCDSIRRDENGEEIKHVSATDEELEKSKNVFNSILEYLKEHNFPEPFTATSGNGFHIFYTLDLDTTEENQSIINNFLKVLSDKFSNDHVDIDTSVKNVARVSKLSGTWSRKGLETIDQFDPSKSRIHRLASYISYPDKKEVVPIELLQEIIDDNIVILNDAVEIPNPAKYSETSTNDEPAKKEQLVYFLNKWGQTYTDLPHNDYGFALHIDCPWKEEHTSDTGIKQTSVFIREGKLCFNCLHGHCVDRGWSDYRGCFEKDEPIYFIGKKGNVMKNVTVKVKDDFVDQVINVTEYGVVIVKEILDKGNSCTYIGEITNGSWKKRFELPASLWGNMRKFEEKLYSIGNGKLMFDHKYIEDVKKSSMLLEPNIKELKEVQLGWNQNYTSYFANECIVTKNGVDKPTNEFFAGNEFVKNQFKFVQEPREEIKETLIHIKDELMKFNDTLPMRCGLGVTFISPFKSQFGMSTNTTNIVPSIIFKGTTGCGKTAMALLLQNFFGKFREKELMSFTSTILSIQEMGYHPKDMMIVVDDLKFHSMHKNEQSQVLKIFQSYLDNHGRGRLQKNEDGNYSSSMGNEIRGTLCITAEDLPDNEASFMSRYMIVPVSNVDKDNQLYEKCLKQSKHYSAVMAYYIFWYLSRTEDQLNNLMKRFELNRSILEKDIPNGQINAVRVCVQLALCYTGFEMFLYFGKSMGVFTIEECVNNSKELLDYLKKLRDSRLIDITENSPSDLFLSTVSSLLASGQCKLYEEFGDEDIQQLEKTNKTIIGSYTKEITYLNATVAFNEVQKALSSSDNKIPFSSRALGQQLDDRGYLIKKDIGKHTTSKRIGGSVTRCFAIDNKLWNLKDIIIIEKNEDIVDFDRIDVSY